MKLYHCIGESCVFVEGCKLRMTLSDCLGSKNDNSHEGDPTRNGRISQGIEGMFCTLGSIPLRHLRDCIIQF